MKNVAYFGFVREKEGIIKYLKKKYNWFPRIVISNFKTNLKISNNTCYIDTVSIRQGAFNYQNLKKIPIDGEIFDKLGSKFCNFLLTLNSSDHFNFNIFQRLNFFSKIFTFWNSVLITYKIDLLVFYTFPHTSSCYSLYLIAKYIFKKKILFINPTPLFNNNFHLINYDLDKLCGLQGKQGLKSQKNQKIIDNFISNIVKKNYRPFYINDFIEQFQSRKILLSGFYKFIKNILKLNAFKISQNDLKINKKKYGVESLSKNYHEFFLLIKKLNSISNLKRDYAKFCEEIDYKKKFIIFFAPYQPEANTVQLAGYFQNIEEIIEILKTDNSYEIYYKEHYANFLSTPANRSYLFRDKNFYANLKSRGVKFLNLKNDNKLLISKSIFTACLNSNAAIESIILNKRCLIFASNWFENIEGIHKINNLKDFNKFKNKKLHKKKINFLRVKKQLNQVLSSSENFFHYKFLKNNLSKARHDKNNEIIGNFIYKKFIQFFRS
jgi:hypothetical protein